MNFTRLLIFAVNQMMRAKRDVPENPPWTPRIVIPPKGAQSCSPWKDIAIVTIAILSLEVLGAILALVICCKSRSSG